MDLAAIIGFYSPIFIFGFFLTCLAVVFALYLFPKLGFVDRPYNYGIDRDPIPYYGGIAIFFPVLIATVLFIPMTKELLGVLIAGFVIFLVSFLDDKFSIKPLIRLFVHMFAALIVVGFGVSILSFQLPFIGVIPLDGLVFDLNIFDFVFEINLLSTLFITFWVMLIINAMNFVDGVSGLNSGVTAIAAFIIFLLSVHPGIHEDPYSQKAIATLALIISSSAFAFLMFDFPKPSILMGDTGSTFFGFMLAILAIFSGGKIATAVLVLGIPLMDLIWVVLRRTFVDRKKFWQGDLMHMHHRLMYFGLSEKQVVLLYLFVSTLFGIFAVVFVDTQQKFFMLIALLILVLVLALMLVFGKRLRSFDVRALSKDDVKKYKNGFLFLSKKVWGEIGADGWNLDNYLIDIPKKWDYSKYIFSDEKIIALIVSSEKNGKPYINKLAVLPEYRRLGLAKILVKEFVDILVNSGEREVLLSVKKSNKSALKFYKKLGFKVFCEEKREEGVFYVMKGELSSLSF